MDKNLTVFLGIIIVCSVMLVAASYSMPFEGHRHADMVKSTVHGHHHKLFDSNNFVMHSFNGIGFLNSIGHEIQNIEKSICLSVYNMGY